MTISPDLRIGIWVDDVRVSKYDRDLIAWARSQPGVVLAALLVSQPSSGSTRTRAWACTLFEALTAIESALLRRQSPRHRDHGDRSEASRLLAGAQTPIIPLSDSDRIAALDVDLIVFLGAELAGHGLPITPRLGMLAFESADPVYRRGKPPAFWEVFERQDTTGFAVKHFAQPGDAGEVLLRGQVPTRHYFLLNQAALQAKAYYYLRSLLARMALTGSLPRPLATVPNSRRPAAVPTALQSLSYLGRSLAAMIAGRLSRMAGREEVWQVAFLRCEWRKAALWKGVSVDNPPGRYLADPFVITRAGRDYFFVEDYDRTEQRGRISVYELGTTDAKQLGAVIDEPFHLSFPYLFEYQEALFMCPESYENSDIRIYRCTEFPMKWALEKIVMSGLRAADTMIFERNGKWWLFTNLDPGNTGEIASELCIFSADTPLDPVWKPHAMNPVRFDAACARNAGILSDGDKVFRVSQRRGFARYGKSAQINEILELSDDTYEERCVETIEPTFQNALLGTHHLHGTESITVFDFLSETSTDLSVAAVKSAAGNWFQRRLWPFQIPRPVTMSKVEASPSTMAPDM